MRFRIALIIIYPCLLDQNSDEVFFENEVNNDANPLSVVIQTLSLQASCDII